MKTFLGRKARGMHRAGGKRYRCPRGKCSRQAFCFLLHRPRSRKSSAPLARGAQTQQQSVEQSSLAGVPALPAFLFSLGSSSTKAMAKAQW